MEEPEPYCEVKGGSGGVWCGRRGEGGGVGERVYSKCLRNKLWNKNLWGREKMELEKKKKKEKGKKKKKKRKKKKKKMNHFRKRKEKKTRTE